MKITWYGTASLSIESGEDKILIDPFVPLKKSPVGTTLEKYTSFKTILITHGHFDHIYSLRSIWNQSKADIYCTKTPCETIASYGVGPTSVHEINPGEKLQFGSFAVTPYQSKHIVFDRELLVHTLVNPRIVKYFDTFLEGGLNHLHCKENNEIVGYLIEAENKQVFVLGSLGLAEEVEYPTGVDMLVLPYQGQSCLVLPALEVVEKLCPKAILLDHFDDTFPPISQEIDTADIQTALEGLIPVIKPKYYEAVEV